jgi:hypothetical protein
VYLTSESTDRTFRVVELKSPAVFTGHVQLLNSSLGGTCHIGHHYGHRRTLNPGLAVGVTDKV